MSLSINSKKIGFILLIILSSCGSTKNIDHTKHSHEYLFKNYLGRGYNIYGGYCDPNSLKASPFDWSKMINMKFIQADFVDRGDEKTHYAFSKEEVFDMWGISADVSYSQGNELFSKSFEGLDFSIGSAGPSISAGFSYGSQKSNSKHGFSAMTYRKYNRFSGQIQATPSDLKNCLSERFKEDVLKKNPKEILDTYGSHYLAHVNLGAALEQTCQSKSESGMNSTTFQTEVKASMPTATGNLDGAIGYTKTSGQSYVKGDITYNVKVIGAAAAGNKTFNEMIEKINKDDQYVTMISINNINEDLNNSTGGLRPIWDLIDDVEKKKQVQEYFDMVWRPQKYENAGVNTDMSAFGIDKNLEDLQKIFSVDWYTIQIKGPGKNYPSNYFKTKIFAGTIKDYEYPFEHDGSTGYDTWGSYKTMLDPNGKGGEYWDKGDGKWAAIIKSESHVELTVKGDDKWLLAYYQLIEKNGSLWPGTTDDYLKVGQLLCINPFTYKQQNNYMPAKLIDKRTKNMMYYPFEEVDAQVIRNKIGGSSTKYIPENVQGNIIKVEGGRGDTYLKVWDSEFLTYNNIIEEAEKFLFENKNSKFIQYIKDAGKTNELGWKAHFLYALYLLNQNNPKYAYQLRVACHLMHNQAPEDKQKSKDEMSDLWDRAKQTWTIKYQDFVDDTEELEWMPKVQY